MDLSYHYWIIHAKFDGICEETGNPISKGDVILYSPGNKRHSASTYSESSKFFQNTAGSIRTAWKIQDAELQEKYRK